MKNNDFYCFSLYSVSGINYISFPSCETTNKISSEGSECFPWEDANSTAEMSSSGCCELCKNLYPYHLAELFFMITDHNSILLCSILSKKRKTTIYTVKKWWKMEIFSKENCLCDIVRSRKVGE